MPYLFVLLAGLGGGILRGLVGYLKYKTSYKEVKFEVKYFVFMVIVSGVIGLIAAWVTRESGLVPSMINPAIAFIVGYAGGDFLENLYKTIGRKPFIVDLPSLIKK